jgi:hypothetical protein
MYILSLSSNLAYTLYTCAKHSPGKLTETSLFWGWFVCPPLNLTDFSLICGWFVSYPLELTDFSLISMGEFLIYLLSR